MSNEALTREWDRKRCKYDSQRWNTTVRGKLSWEAKFSIADIKAYAPTCTLESNLGSRIQAWILAILSQNLWQPLQKAPERMWGSRLLNSLTPDQITMRNTVAGATIKYDMMHNCLNHQGYILKLQSENMLPTESWSTTLSNPVYRPCCREFSFLAYAFLSFEIVLFISISLLAKPITDHAYQTCDTSRPAGLRQGSLSFDV